MKRADFYLLNGSTFSDQLNFCCRLAEKALSKNNKIHIQTTESIQNEALNEALWAFKAESFLPHAVGQDQFKDYPITIDTGSDKLNLNPMEEENRNLLILLANTLPANYASFERLSLVIINQKELIQESRELYKRLKNERYEVHIHDQRRQET